MLSCHIPQGTLIPQYNSHSYPNPVLQVITQSESAEWTEGVFMEAIPILEQLGVIYTDETDNRYIPPLIMGVSKYM